MSQFQFSDDEFREAPRSGRDDLLRLVRQHLSRTARIVRLSGRTRRAVGSLGLGAASSPGDGRD